MIIKEGSTKEKILLESMKLFAENGFEAVSVRAIAAAVGVRDSALYKHFKSKQQIFDALVEISKEKFLEKYASIKQNIGTDFDFVEMCMNVFYFQTQDEWIVKFRQMLIIEQFKNPEIAAIYKFLFIDQPIEMQTRIFMQLIREGKIKGNNPKVMAIELYAPFFLYHTTKFNEDNLEELLRLHAKNFMKMYFKQKT